MQNQGSRWRARASAASLTSSLRAPDGVAIGVANDPSRLSFKVAALGVDAGHAPGPWRGAGKGRGIKLESIGMIPVHVLDNARLALKEGLGVSKRQEKVVRTKIEDASEAADVVGALDRQAPKAKSGKSA